MYGMARGAPRRRSVIVAAASAALLLGVSACTGGDGESGGGPTEITFSYLWGGKEAEALEKIIADFNASQDKIVVKGVSNPDFQAQLTAMSASEGSFDISDQFGNTVGSWSAKGILAPLDEYLDDTDDFIPAAMEQMTHDGKIYSVPIATHSFQLLYNNALFAKAGITQPPATMEALADAVAKLTKLDAGGKITQLGIGNPDAATTLTTLGYAFGGQWDGEKGPTPAEDGNIKAVQWWQDTVIKPYGADKVAAFTAGFGPYMSPEDPFHKGKVAMVIDGEWRAVNIPDTAPNLDWGVAPIPTAAAGKEGTTQLTASTLFIPANSKHKKEAAEFLKYMVSKEAMRTFSLALGNLPGRVSLLDDPAYGKIPRFDAWLDALKSDNTFALASRPYSQEYATDLGAAFNEVIRGAKSAKDALDAVADKSASYQTD
jgi:multiple sugar transport system substrate-binding protein